MARFKTTLAANRERAGQVFERLRETWILFSHCLVFHGRTVCLARKPQCVGCPISDLCPFPTARKE